MKLYIDIRRKGTSSFFVAPLKFQLDLACIALFKYFTATFYFQVVLTLGLLHNAQHYSGTVFQIACKAQGKKRKDILDVLAAGSRYDNLVCQLFLFLERSLGTGATLIFSYCVCLDSFLWLPIFPSCLFGSVVLRYIFFSQFIFDHCLLYTFPFFHFSFKVLIKICL